MWGTFIFCCPSKQTLWSEQLPQVYLPPEGRDHYIDLLIDIFYCHIMWPFNFISPDKFTMAAHETFAVSKPTSYKIMNLLITNMLLNVKLYNSISYFEITFKIVMHFKVILPNFISKPKLFGQISAWPLTKYFVAQTLIYNRLLPPVKLIPSTSMSDRTVCTCFCQCTELPAVLIVVTHLPFQLRNHQQMSTVSTYGRLFGLYASLNLLIYSDEKDSKPVC